MPTSCQSFYNLFIILIILIVCSAENKSNAYAFQKQIKLILSKTLLYAPINLLNTISVRTIMYNKYLFTTYRPIGIHSRFLYAIFVQLS